MFCFIRALLPDLCGPKRKGFIFCSFQVAKVDPTAMELETLEAVHFNLIHDINAVTQLLKRSITQFHWWSIFVFIVLVLVVFISLCLVVIFWSRFKTRGDTSSSLQSAQVSVDCREAVCDAEMWMSCLPNQVCQVSKRLMYDSWWCQRDFCILLNSSVVYQFRMLDIAQVDALHKVLVELVVWFGRLRSVHNWNSPGARRCGAWELLWLDLWTLPLLSQGPGDCGVSSELGTKDIGTKQNQQNWWSKTIKNQMNQFE